MAEKIVPILNQNSETSLSISFVLQATQYRPMQFQSVEELVNWTKFNRDRVSSCLVMNGCHGVESLARVQELLKACQLEMTALLVTDALSVEIEEKIAAAPELMHCLPQELAEEIRRVDRDGGGGTGAQRDAADRLPGDRIIGSKTERTAS